MLLLQPSSRSRFPQSVVAAVVTGGMMMTRKGGLSLQGPAAEHETSREGPSIIQYQPRDIFNQAISVDGAFCATHVQPVSSPSLAMPMDAETTSNNANTLGLTREHLAGSLVYVIGILLTWMPCLMI
jgi:hypothetical protein